ncbi:biotin carboxylase N-terminal domain-containing protein [uncultured Salinisphaera sp.]|uniref:acetyl/propionyl/methylcrotonyl-CoA carboxylase subunit alpha n=1 Tax=uncultured Salinisphaera sp. TaxID=359372 RepID=UPI0032B2CE6D|tara:strand:- start:1448 stop:3184 length:1737 start_codon:yes stop_codon:yes gene_type:complete
MNTLLIANRGEIAVRVIRAAREAELTSVAVYADDDADALHVRLADAAYALEGNDSEATYLNADKLIAVARRAGADAVHPGYGFLSENADFARAVIDAGLTWVGPSSEAIEALGNKLTARAIAKRVGAPMAPGTTDPVDNAEAVEAFAEEHGLPIIIKAAHGGGGRGMKIVHEAGDIADAFDSAVREANTAFGRGECFVERYLSAPRHVEAQILADSHGHIIVAGTRDCSLQRRNQKLVEEAPAPYLTHEQRQRIHDSAKAICREAGYTSAGTVEYLVAPDGLISFLEVNTRLQVEHPVTEATSGLDIVAEQLRIARGEPLSVTDDPPATGHALEFRLNAEDPARGFLPFPGTVTRFETPTGPGIRVDTGITSGGCVSEHFDSLIAKLIVTGQSREHAIGRARAALAELVIEGLPTVVPFHRAVLEQPAFTDANAFAVHTHWIETEFADTLAASEHLAQASAGPARQRFTIELDGKAVQLGLPGALLAALGNTSQSPAASEHADESTAEAGQIKATLNGRFVKWRVDEGATVAKDEPVAVLEAMKMETTLYAPTSGTLARQKIAAGDAVRQGDVLATVT